MEREPNYIDYDSSHEGNGDEQFINLKPAELSDSTLKNYLRIMRVNYDSSSSDRTYLDRIFTNAINDPFRKQNLLTRLRELRERAEQPSSANSNMIGRRREREEDIEIENISLQRRQSNLSDNQLGSQRGGSAAQVNLPLRLSTLNTVFSPGLVEGPRVSNIPPTSRLTRLEVIDSIQRTSLTDSNLVKKADAAPLFNWKKELTEIIALFGSVSLGLALIVYFKPQIANANFAQFPWVDAKIIILTLLLIAALAAIYFLYQKHQQALIREHRLIADNCFGELKKHLLEGESEFLFEEEFVAQYCNTNTMKEEVFRMDILPYIKEQLKDDPQVKETHMNYEGGVKVVWILK